MNLNTAYNINTCEKFNSANLSELTIFISGISGRSGQLNCWTMLRTTQHVFRRLVTNYPQLRNQLLLPGKNANYGNSNNSNNFQITFILGERRNFHRTSINNDLMEFFDDKKNWGESKIQVGRSWRIDELRIRSNTDLHKLWYILLKERNMLMTMEYECQRLKECFPNPERLDKVNNNPY